MTFADGMRSEFPLSEFPIRIRNRFKCGHEEEELAGSPEEARHLRESAPYWDCIRCLVQMIPQGGNACPAPKPAETQTSASA